MASIASVFGAVGRHQRSPVADPLDEPAQHQPGLGQLRILFRQANFGGPLLEQGQHGAAGYRGSARAGRYQVGHPDR